MTLLPRFPLPDSDSVQRPRERLVSLRCGVQPGCAPGSLPDPDDQEPAGAQPATNGQPVPVDSRGGRLVRRWIPDPLREARWEPGRPGAAMLSLVAALAAVIAAVGVWWQRPVPEPAPVLPLITSSAATAPSASAPPGAANQMVTGAANQMVISVVGRVSRPGLVRLPDGARIADALDAAGGAIPGTDLTGLNLARRLSDGEQLLVGVAPPPGQPVDGAEPAPSGPSPKVDLNTATLEQLDALPFVGRVTAQRILDWRTAHGRFRSVDQLRQVDGIGPARFARLKDLVRV